jgi:uncharacterized phage protein gp47/JayE
MSWVRPTLNELVVRIQEDLVSRLELSGALLRRSFLYVLARVLAGAAHMVHGQQEFYARQIFPDQAEAEFLARHASLFGMSRNAATFAQGTIDVTGDAGEVVPEGTVYVRADGWTYETDAELTLDGSGEGSVAVTAVTAGVDGNADEGTVLTLESPISGVDSEATVDADELSEGADQETDDDLRVRLLERLRNPPQGGSEADLIAWAKEISGVTRVWISAGELGAGTVSLRFVRDDDGDGADIIPDAGEIEAVQDHIDEERPVTMDVTVLAPTAVPLAFTISLEPDNSETRAAVEAELADMLNREAEPGGTILRSQMLVAIGIAEGVEDFTLTVPAADETHAVGELAIMGTITWT